MLLKIHESKNLASATILGTISAKRASNGAFGRLWINHAVANYEQTTSSMQIEGAKAMPSYTTGFNKITCIVMFLPGLWTVVHARATPGTGSAASFIWRWQAGPSVGFLLMELAWFCRPRK